MSQSCRACSSLDLIEIINLGKQPIAHRLVSSPQDSEFTHPLVLHYCQNCGLVQICNPIDPSLLYLDYNYCFSAWKPQPHIIDEIETILTHVQTASVFEVGCNDGTFLEALKQKGVSLGVGVEPNPYASELARNRGFHVFSEMLSPDLCKEVVEKFGKFDTVVARQVLEHLQDIESFFACANILLNESGFLFIDVPDFEVSLSMGDCSTIWEEHINYFTQSVLASLLERFGYQSISIRHYNFSGGTVAILAQQKSLIDETDRSMVNCLEIPAREYSEKVGNYGELLRTTLSQYRSRGFKIVLYGVGCRACTVVNGLGLGQHIDFAIDDQQERQHKYMPGSKLSILPTQVLSNYAEDGDRILCLLAVNQENETAVREKLRDIITAKIEFASLLSPTNIVSELKRLNH
jgi:2-polyprenyl-3-methyl-5-hydroxy-6-metoxy-1,4-benzoquinol methylase